MNLNIIIVKEEKKIQDFFKNYFKTSLFLLTQTALTHISEEKKNVRSWSNVIAWLCVIRYKLAI